jgi:hypothetical protein
MVPDTRDAMLTAEQALEKYQPHLESQIDLEPGLVLWKPFAAGDSREDGDGTHYLYVGWGDLEGLDTNLTAFHNHSYIRNRIAAGLFRRVDIEDLSDELKTARIEALRDRVQSLREVANQSEEEGRHESAATIREQANTVVDVLEAAGEEI